VGVEEKTGPVRRGSSTCHEVGNRLAVAGDDGFLLPRESRLGLGMLAPMDDHLEPPLVDPGAHLDGDVERGRAELLEPKAVLLDEVERDSIRARRARRQDGRLDFEFFPRLDHSGKGGACPVPDDRVPERIEPVVGELHAVTSSGPPRRGAGVDESYSSGRARAGTQSLELVGVPADREWPRRYRMLADPPHVEG
jgi:hypothetical protein